MSYATEGAEGYARRPGEASAAEAHYWWASAVVRKNVVRAIAPRKLETAKTAKMSSMRSNFSKWSFRYSKPPFKTKTMKRFAEK